jgi:imidazoleglycerol-phosphate dehydratase
MRSFSTNRKTNETNIEMSLLLEGKGQSEIDTGCGFLDHMLTLFAKHGRFDLTVKCTGDAYVDFHHTVEDVAICLGSAFAKALGDCRGIVRYGSFLLPMDEALVMCAVDISGRYNLSYGLSIPSAKVGEFDTELTEEFMAGFARKAGVCIHLRQLDGRNSHHIIEAAFKALARAMSEAVAIDARFADEIPSTKGMLV